MPYYKNIKFHFVLYLFSAILLTIFLNAIISYAGIMEEVYVERIVKSSDIIILGKCLTSYCDWNSEKTEICTYSLIDILQTLKGREESHLVIETLGGQVGYLVSTVINTPAFVEGEDVLLFIFRKRSGQFGIVGFNKGKFNICQRDGKRVVKNPFVSKIIIQDDNNPDEKSEPDMVNKEIILEDFIKMIKAVISTE